MINKYVLKHDFYYGKNNGEINKLFLRDFKDLKDYLKDAIEFFLLAARVNSSFVICEAGERAKEIIFEIL